MGGETFGAMANGIQSSTTGIGSLIMYVFALVGVILTGMGIHGFYAHSKNPNRDGGMRIAAVQTIVGIILAGGLLYMINSGSMTMGAGTSTTLQSVVNP